MPRLLLTAFSVAALVGTVAARQGTDTVGVALVTVVNSRNEPTVDVDAADFLVSQGDKPREIIGVRIADYPVVLVLDNSAGPGDLDAIRSATTRFVETIGDRAVAVLTLTEPPTTLASFDDDRASVLEQIKELSATPAARRAPLHALGAAADRVRESGAQFSGILLVSASPLEEAQVEPAGFLRSFLASRAILNVVTKGLSIKPGGSRSEGILRDMANRSGGRHLLIYSAASFPVALDQIADRLQTEMMIEYLVPAGSANDQEVRVGVKVPGARVRGLGVAR
jgi:hypothetical protein